MYIYAPLLLQPDLLYVCNDGLLVRLCFIGKCDSTTLDIGTNEVLQ